MTKSTPKRKPIPGNARSAAVDVLLRVYDADAYANRAVESALEHMRLSPKDRTFARALIYGTLARTVTLDHVIGTVARRPLNRMEPAIRIILRLGVWQLLYSHSVPDRAACSESVRLARHYANPGAAGMVNGVLRNLASNKPDPSGLPFALRYSLPDWLADGIRSWAGPERADLVAEACNRIPPLTVRANTLQTDRDNLKKQFEDEGIAASDGAFHPEALIVDLQGQSLTDRASFRDGGFTVQDEAAMLVSTVLDPQPGEKIADLCAAPGGKSCHMAALASDRADILAGDIHASQLERIRENAERLGIHSIQPVEQDAADTGLPSASFDRVLCDVPCSGLGLLARKPEIRLRVHPDGIRDLAAIQSRILDEAVRILKPGGVLVYSTCTLHPDENEHQMDHFLARHGDKMKPFGFADRIPDKLVERDPDTKEDAARGQLRLLPGVHECDGFFIARCIRRDEP